MTISRKSKFSLLLLASIILGGCIFSSDDDRPSRSDGDEDTPPPVTPEDGNDPDKVFEETTLHSFTTPFIDDIEDNVDDDIISASLVNYDLPVVNIDDDDEDNDDEDDLIFNLDANDWYEEAQAWNANETAPNEDSDAALRRNYFLLSSNGWEESISNNKSEFHYIDENFIREYHLGVARDWYFPDIEIDIVQAGETRTFTGEIDGRKLSDWSDWLVSLGFPEHAEDFVWAKEKEVIDDDKFSDGAEVIGVQRWVISTRYQVEQNYLEGDVNKRHIYQSVAGNTISKFSELDGETGRYNDSDKGMSFILNFDIGGAIPTCPTSDDSTIGTVTITSDAAVAEADIAPQCENRTLVLMLNLNKGDKEALGFYDPFDLFLAEMEIDGKALIYMGKRYNKTTSSNADDVPFEVFYNDIATQDIQNTFKSWRDQDHEENGDD